MTYDEEKALDQMLKKLDKPVYDVDHWLIEDETEEFERILHRKKSVGWRWMAAAAVLMGALWIFHSQQDSLPPHPRLTVAEATEVQVSPGQDESNIKVVQQEQQLKRHVRVTDKGQDEMLTQVNDVAKTSMTPIDSLTDILACIQQRLNDVRDSCYIANMERTIFDTADLRMRRFVDQMVSDGIITDSSHIMVMKE